MAASPKTRKSTGSDQKASASGRKTSASQRKTTGAQGKTSDSQRKTGGSAQKSSGSASNSRPKAAAGSAQKTRAASRRSGTGSKQKAAGSRPKASAGSKQKTANSEPQKGIYVYGILPADIELTSDMPGVGDPPGQVGIVRSDGLAALVSEVDVSKPLGSPRDLVAHEQIVDASAGEVPVLPARFGAVLKSKEAVAEELLGANHDEFEEALEKLEGRAQYVVKGRYADNVILQEILSENRQAARLRDKLRGADPDATRDTRIKLGEIINEAVSAKRHKDTHALGHAMEGHCVASVVREPTHELDAVHVAFLMETDHEDEMEQVIERLAQDWEGRIEVRLLGPMAAYDFVGLVHPEG
jgi:Gas vesicle synthesis protein GvpL/GvpF